MSSQLLYLSAAISALTSVAHSNMHFDVAPAFQSLSLPASICGLNAWWQVGGYFLLNGMSSEVASIHFLAVQQARWAKYGIVTSYDKILFWGLNALYTAAGCGYATKGVVPPQIAFFANVAVMQLRRLLA